MRYFINNQNELYASDNPFGRDVTGTGFERFYPLTHTHIGSDFATPVGTPIYAPTNGEMVKAEVSTPKGNVGVFCFTDPNGTVYGLELCHLRQLPKLGQYKEGDIIAYTGMTGTACTGPHLHTVMHKDCIVKKHYDAIGTAGHIDWQHGRAMFLSLLSAGNVVDTHATFLSYNIHV